MADLETIRKIAITIYWLRHALRGRSANVTDTRMAQLLNEARRDPRSFELNAGLVNKIRHVKYDFRGTEATQVLAALQSICSTHEMNVDLSEPLPQEIEELYSRELPDAFVRPDWLPLQGQPLASTATALAGLWRCMYYSPVNRRGEFKPEVRGSAAIFSSSKAAATTIPCLLISQHTRWKGHGFVNDTHLYFFFTDVTKFESAFFVTNKPSTHETFIAGVGAIQERDLARRDQSKRPPVASFVCFGEKVSLDGYNYRESVQRAMGGEGLSAEQEQAIRAAFCETLSLNELRQKHETLHDYLNSISINDARGLAASPLIYVAYK